jgi:hypothetical protein
MSASDTGDAMETPRRPMADTGDERSSTAHSFFDSYPRFRVQQRSHVSHGFNMLTHPSILPFIDLVTTGQTEYRKEGLKTEVD